VLLHFQRRGRDLQAEASFLEDKLKSKIYSNVDANRCAGAKLALDNALCTDLGVPQAGANVTLGYKGKLDVSTLGKDGTPVTPQTNPYWQSSMCPVNVHWHLGSEHYSVGEFDENGKGPHGNQPRPSWANRDLAEADAEVQDGFRCHHYDENDEKFTKPYEWKHCVGMEVGETYEVHVSNVYLFLLHDASCAHLSYPLLRYVFYRIAVAPLRRRSLRYR